MIEPGPQNYNQVALASAESFRLLMDAMSRPGSIMDLPVETSSVGAMNPGASLTALTLCDHETPVWLSPELRGEPEIDFLRFQTGCPITDRKEDAMFAFFGREPEASELEGFSAGIPAYPDRSVTLVIQIEALSDDGPLTLRGPGIRSTHRLGVNGLGENFWQWWGVNASRFPLGMDVILAGQRQLAALPRSLKILEAA